MVLRAGDRLPLWQVGGLTESPYDVEDAPMQGEMDSLFFLTKDKNYIPHTYPCRTAYAAEVAGKKPIPGPAPDWQSAKVRLPFGAPLLDLSGFWFRPTRVQGWARTALRAREAGPARLRLGTCGAALLFVNGQEAGWLAPAVRNALAETEITVDLVAGHNVLSVWLDDLAERDARILLSVEWLDGPETEQAVACDNDPALVAEVEAALATVHFDRTSYDSQDVVLNWPCPLDTSAELGIRVAGDFMSHDSQSLRFELAAGQTRLVLGHSRDFPADYRHFELTLKSGGFEASRVLGAEISHRSAQGAVAPDLSDRIDETLNWIAAHSERDTVTALACLATGRTEHVSRAQSMIARSLPPIEACWDCADFALVPLLWSRLAYGHQLGRDLRDRIDAAILGYRYWMDEPGNDVQWYFSENHALLFHTSAYLAGGLFPDQVFRRSGRVGAAQSDAGRDRVRAWFDHFEQAEMAEFNSAPYFPIDLKGLTALFAFAPDADIRARASAAIIRLVTIVANSAHHGVVTAAQGRSYEHTLCAGETLELSGLARLLWGQGAIGARVHCLPQMALCLRDRGLELPDLTARARWEREDAQEWCFWQGQDGFARLYHYKTRETALGSAACYRWGDWGYQETLIHGRLGRDPQAQIWINHPGELVQSGYGRPSYWGGSASVPRVQQYRDLAVVRFAGVAPQPDLTHCWFPTARFDEWTLNGARATARSGQGVLALQASSPLELTQTGPSAGCELKLAGRDGLWALRLGQADTAAAHSARHELQVQQTDDDALIIDDPDYGRVIFAADGTVEAEGRKLNPNDWTREGQRRNLPLASGMVPRQG